ncbi:MAG: AAA family ATPase [Candidatus Zixiibacteriota bacterium]
MNHRIVITGAPGSGKTDFLLRLSTHSTFSRFTFFDELARQLLIEDPSIRQDKRRFHGEIYRRQTSRERAVDGPFITDRGTVDAFAFHPETLIDVATSLSREYKRYSAAIQLGSAARLGDNFYRCDAVRNETIEDALIIEEALRRVWQGHPGYHFVSAQPDYEAKYQEFLSLLNRITDRSGADTRQPQHEKH